MTDRIKRAFAEVRASDTLKENTLRRITRGYRPKANLGGYLLIPAAIALFSGAAAWLYFTPISVISIDVNPSVELGVNRFERVISAEGFGEDGRSLAEKLEVSGMNYKDALSEVLDEEDIASRLSAGEAVVISVVSLQDGEQSALIAENVELDTADTENIYCHHSSYEYVAEAHSHGLSYGKYLAFLEAEKENPGLTPDDAKNLTMRDLHELCGHEHGGDDTAYESDGTDESDFTAGNGYHHDGGHHYGNGHHAE